MKAATSERKDFIAYPTNRVVGTVPDADKARAVTDALLRAGFAREDIEILHGDEDLHRLDPDGSEHGFLAQFQRMFIRTFDLEEFKHLTHLADDVRAGRFVVMVMTKRRGLRILAADILHQYGAEYVGFYGRWALEDLPAHPHTTPEDFPALFAQAWNARDPEALAALFDDDAEFVNVTGLCWHDRDSIRKAHARRLARLAGKSTLATSEMRVKRLSPEVALVHAHMTLSADDGAAAANGARMTLVSFVLHRAGERWLCAAAHNTDVASKAATAAPEEAGVLGLAGYPSEQAS